MLSFLEKISCIIVGIEDGLEGSIKTVGVIFGDLRTNPPRVSGEASMVQHDGTILVCGGFKNEQKCLQLDHGTWKEHSTLNQKRRYHSAVKTQTATFLFGGVGVISSRTYEYLPKGSTSWLMGKTEIPGGFFLGCASLVKSDQEIWLIGGAGSDKRILSFNVNDHTFRELALQLNRVRIGHNCAFIPNTKKIMIAGGCSGPGEAAKDCFNSTDILDTENETITAASPMNSVRSFHGMGVLTINGEDRLAVFGGFIGRKWLDSVETYNSQTEKWEIPDIKLDEPKLGVGFLTVKLSDIITELQFINTASKNLRQFL